MKENKANHVNMQKRVVFNFHQLIYIVARGPETNKLTKWAFKNIVLLHVHLKITSICVVNNLLYILLEKS